MPLLVAVLVVVGHVLVEVLERAPAVEVIPEVVEGLDLVLGRVLVAKLRYRVDLAEAGLGLEDVAPELVEVALGELLLGRRRDVGILVDRVKLTALDGIKEDFSRLLDALEEVVILDTTGGGLLVGVVLQDLLAVGPLNLVLSGLVAVLGEAKDFVVILRLQKWWIFVSG